LEEAELIADPAIKSPKIKIHPIPLVAKALAKIYRDSLGAKKIYKRKPKYRRDGEKELCGHFRRADTLTGSSNISIGRSSYLKPLFWDYYRWNF
jgi:hypothetical protein